MSKNQIFLRVDGKDSDKIAEADLSTGRVPRGGGGVTSYTSE